MNSAKNILIAIGAYMFVFGAMTSLRHYNFETQAWDLGVFAQIMWNITHGNGMATTLEFANNHFAVHMSPFLFLLAPLYFLFSSPYALLITQTIVLALGAWPLYLLALKILGGPRQAFLVSVAYLLYPPLHRVNWFDFHPVAFLIPALIAAAYFAEIKRWKWMSLFLLVAASTQEDAALAVAFFGLYLAARSIAERRRAATPSRSFSGEMLAGIFVFLLAASYVLISAKLVMPSFGGGLARLDRYSQLGSSPGEIARNVFFRPSVFVTTLFTPAKFSYLLWLFLPLALLPLFAPKEWILLVPGLAQNLLTRYEPQFSGMFQYDAVLVAGLFIASIAALKNLAKISPAYMRAGTYLFLAAAALSFLWRSPVGPKRFPVVFFSQDDRRRAFREMIRGVPPEATVAAHTQIVPHLANRERIYTLGSEPLTTDVVLVDGADYFGFPSPEAFETYVQQYASSGRYRPTIINERFYAIRKVAPEPGEPGSDASP